MKKIDYNIKVDNYSNEDMIGKIIYMKRNDNDNECHHIFIIKDIIGKNPSHYLTNKQYILKTDKVFEDDNIKLTYHDILYELDRIEYIDIFKEFVNNEGISYKDIKKGLLL